MEARTIIITNLNISTSILHNGRLTLWPLIPRHMCILPTVHENIQVQRNLELVISQIQVTVWLHTNACMAIDHWYTL